MPSLAERSVLRDRLTGRQVHLRQGHIAPTGDGVHGIHQ